MKNKWLIVLFVFFLAVVFLSLLISRQSQEVASSYEKKDLVADQAESMALPVYSPQAAQVKVAELPVAKSAITIIKDPSMDRKAENIRTPKVVDPAKNNTPSLNVIPSVEEESSPLDAGITKTGKLPPAQETREMNSRGIVLY